MATSQSGLCPVGTLSLWLHPSLGMPCRNPVTVATSQSGLCPVGTLSLWLHMHANLVMRCHTDLMA